MKNSFAVAILLFVATALSALAQQSPPKRPLKVPADAKFFNGKWYLAYLEKKSWNDAKQRCNLLGGQLAIVPDEATWTFIKELAGNASLWLGASDERKLDLWEWVDGTPVTFTAWLQGQPDHGAQGKERYVHTRWAGWNDAQRSGVIDDRTFVVGFICEWKNK